MMIAVFLLIALTAAAPSIFTEGRREKEKELIFRGEQYAHAIYLFDLQFHRYPTSVKELLHTNDMSFLRQRFRDPMAANGKWRFIHATANGVVTDSETLQQPGQQQGENGSTRGSPGGPGSSSFGNGMGASSGTSAFGNVEGAFIVGVASTSKQMSIMTFNNHDHYNHWEFIGIPGLPGSVIQTVNPAGFAAPGQPSGFPIGSKPTGGFGSF